MDISFDPEEWRQFGTQTAQPHIRSREYQPLLPNAPAFFQDGVYLVSRYACYLRAYRKAFQERGLRVPPLKTIRQLLKLDAPAPILSFLKAA